MFKGAGTMRFERGAQRLLFLRKETLTGRAQPPAMPGPSGRLPSGGDVLGPGLNIPASTPPARQRPESEKPLFSRPATKRARGRRMLRFFLNYR